MNSISPSPRSAAPFGPISSRSPEFFDPVYMLPGFSDGGYSGIWGTP
jgi:hypothetical protein